MKDLRPPLLFLLAAEPDACGASPHDGDVLDEVGHRVRELFLTLREVLRASAAKDHQRLSVGCARARIGTLEEPD